jgi:hypothetical protein
MILKKTELPSRVRGLMFTNNRQCCTTMHMMVSRLLRMRRGGILQSCNALVIDAIGSVAFHPVRPILLSVSGSRHFDGGSENRAKQSPPTDLHESLSSEEDNGSELEDESSRSIRLPGVRPQPVVRDSCIRLWDFGGPVPLP